MFRLRNQENFKVPPMSRAAIRAAAYNVRAQLGIADEKYIDVARLLELILFQIPDFVDYDIVSPSDLGELEAATLVVGCGQSKILIRDSVYDDLRKGLARPRFTVAHELGHAFLHSRLYGGPRDYVSNDWPAFRSSEWQANEFGGELLAPAHLIQDITSVNEIAEQFGVSTEVARRRLLNAVK